MNTPDTEKCKNCRDLHNGSIIKVDDNGACVFCNRQVTPDTEWTKEFDLLYPCRDIMCDQNGTSCGGAPEEPEPVQCEYCYRERLPLKDLVRKAITSRDTYWKEELRKRILSHKYPIGMQNPIEVVDVEDIIRETQ